MTPNTSKINGFFSASAVLGLLVILFSAQNALAAALPGNTLGLFLSQRQVVGGNPVTVTLVLSGVSVGCQSIPVSYATTAPGTFSGPNAIQVCPQLLRGTRGGSMTVQPDPTASGFGIRIFAAGFSADLDVSPPDIASFALEPSSVIGTISAVVEAEVTFDGPLPSCHPLTVIAPAPLNREYRGCVNQEPGARTVVLAFPAPAVEEPTVATVCATSDVTGTELCADVELLPIGLGSFQINPGQLTGGEATTGRVVLNAEASPGGIEVQILNPDPSAITTPETVNVPYGESAVEFPIQTHDVGECREIALAARLRGITGTATLSIGVTELVSDADDGEDAFWGARHATTVEGAVLWMNGDDAYFEDGAGTLTLIQERVDASDNDLGEIADNVFALGSDALAGEVIGVWRRNTDDAWLWRSGQDDLLLVANVNPYDPESPLNPQEAAVADGCVFWLHQAFHPDFNDFVTHVYRVDPDLLDPVTGEILPTSVSGTGAVHGAERVATSECQAAWVFDPTPLGEDPLPLELHFYDGVATRVVDSADSLDPLAVRLERGRIVYTKRDANAIEQVYLYDSTQPAAAPFQLSDEVDPARGAFRPATDGRHVAWLAGDADASKLQVTAGSGLVLNQENAGPADLEAGGFEHPLQLDAGQLLWSDATDTLQYYYDGRVQPVCSVPAVTTKNSWLRDGFVVWHGETDAPNSDTEVFRFTGPAPEASDPPPPLVVAARGGDRAMGLVWSPVLGAASYNLYLAVEPGVSSANYTGLAGGWKLEDISSPLSLTGLSNDITYYAVLTSVEHGQESGNSLEVSATPGALDPDTDGDGVQDADDNCSFVANPNQEDRSGNGGEPDGVGDACQCGDPNESGAYESGDLLEVFNCLQDDAVAQGVCEAVLFRADANGSGAFESGDLLLIYRALVGQTSGAELFCPARLGASIGGS